MSFENDTMTIDGVPTTLEVMPQVVSGRTLIPLRAMAEAVNKEVFWDEKGLIVISGNAKVFDSKTDDYLIDELIRQVNLR